MIPNEKEIQSKCCKQNKQPEQNKGNQSHKESDDHLSEIAVDPHFGSAFLLKQLSRHLPENIGVMEIARGLIGQEVEIGKGDLRTIDSVLLAESNVLHALFNRLIFLSNKIYYPKQISLFIDLALRVQNQCRKTLVSLADIKNPKRFTFVGQQNNAMNQQINNDNNSSNKDSNPKGAKKSKKNMKNPSNELLSSQSELNLLKIKPNETVDFGREKTTVKTDSEMETLDKSRC